MRIIDANTYLEALVSDENLNLEFSVPVKGVSMLPFLREDRDRVIMKKYYNQNLKEGDVLLFQRFNGDFVLHRIMEINEGIIVMLGDNQLSPELISVDQVRAIAIKAVRKGREITAADWTWRFFSMYWRRWIFLRRLSASISKAKRKIIRSK